MKVGTVALVGRPNVGKSSLLNSIMGHKVSIVSGKPQTTRGEIVVVYESDKGQIFFRDTPGFYQGKAVSNYNRVIAKSIADADVVCYVVDLTRDWGSEDERIWHMIEDSQKPVLLVINKLDQIEHKDFSKSYEILVGKHVADTVRVSAINETHVASVISKLLGLLPEGERDATVDSFESPIISQTSADFLADIVREKIYSRCGAEVPYQVRTSITEIDTSGEVNKIKGLVIVSEEHYKPMLIGKNGKMIASITKAVQKELWIATGKEAKVRLMVVTTDDMV